MKLQSRRSFLARSAELASTAPLLMLIGRNFSTRTSYYEIDSTNTSFLEKPSKKILSGIAMANGPVGSALNNLHSKYREAYYKSHTRIVPYTRRVGKSTTIGFRTETYYTWEEPSNIPNHEVIDSWREYNEGITKHFSGLFQGATFDVERIKELEVVKKRIGEGREGLASLGIYAPQIAALLFYEEAIAKMKHGYEKHASAEELVERHDTQPQITRRSFFKIGAAIAGAGISLPITEKNNGRSLEGKVLLENEIAEMETLARASPGVAFAKYFGTTPNAIIDSYNIQIASAEQTLRTGVENKPVRTAFEEFVRSGRKLTTHLEEVFGQGVPEEIGNLAKSTYIARRLKDKSVSEHRAVYTRLGLTGLAVASAMAATLIPLELLNEYFANKFEQ